MIYEVSVPVVISVSLTAREDFEPPLTEDQQAAWSAAVTPDLIRAAGDAVAEVVCGVAGYSVEGTVSIAGEVVKVGRAVNE